MDQQSKTIQLTFQRRNDRAFGGGFYQNWVSGESGPTKFGLDAGAGLGNPLLTFWTEGKDGKRTYWDLNVKDIVEGMLSLGPPK